MSASSASRPLQVGTRMNDTRPVNGRFNRSSVMPWAPPMKVSQQIARSGVLVNPDLCDRDPGATMAEPRHHDTEQLPPGRMTRRAERPLRARGPEVPATLLLGPASATTAPSVGRLARRLAVQLGHQVEPCALEGRTNGLGAVVRRLVARGTKHLVLLPLALDAGGLADGRRADPITAAMSPWPALRVHRGRPPAIDDIARMLGDRARDAAASLT